MAKKRNKVPSRPKNRRNNIHKVFQKTLKKIYLSILRMGQLRWDGEIMTLKNCPVLFKLFIEGQISIKWFLEFLFKDNFLYKKYKYEQIYGQLNVYLNYVSIHKISNVQFFSQGNKLLRIEKEFMRDFLSFVFPILPLAMKITIFGRSDINNIEINYLEQANYLLKIMDPRERLEQIYQDKKKNTKKFIGNFPHLTMDQSIQLIVRSIQPDKYDYATKMDIYNLQFEQNNPCFLLEEIDHLAYCEKVNKQKKQIKKLYQRSLTYQSKFIQNPRLLHTQIKQYGGLEDIDDKQKIEILNQWVQFFVNIKQNTPEEYSERKDGLSQKVKSRHKPSKLSMLNRQNIYEDYIIDKEAYRFEQMFNQQQSVSDLNCQSQFQKKNIRDPFDMQQSFTF